MLFKCSYCGAPLNTTHAERSVICNYCHNETRLPERALLSGPMSTWLAALPGRRGILGVCLLFIGGSAVIAWCLLTMFVDSFVHIVPKPTVSRSAASASPVEPEIVLWDDQRSPVARDLDGDGIEEVFGIHAVYTHGTNSAYLGVFDGKRFTHRWKFGPFAHTESYKVKFALLTSRVLISDAKAFLHILDAGDGRELATVKLNDRAERFCQHPQNPSKAIVMQVDGNAVELDLASGETQAAAAGLTCPASWHVAQDRYCLSHPPELTECKLAEALAQTPGFEPKYAFQSGPQIVAVGSKPSGSQWPMLAGYTSIDQPPTWIRLLNSGDPSAREGVPTTTDVSANRLVIAYQATTTNFHLQAVDIRTGEALWDQPLFGDRNMLPPGPIRVSPTRVYVPQDSKLRIVELNTGKLIATIGGRQTI